MTAVAATMTTVAAAVTTTMIAAMTAAMVTAVVTVAAVAVFTMIVSVAIAAASVATVATVAAAKVTAAKVTAPACSNVYSPKKPERSNVGIRHRQIRVIGEGRIRRPPPVPVDNLRIVTRHIDNLRIDRINFDTITFDNHLLLGARVEIALSVCFRAESLNGCRYTVFLIRVSVTQPLGPGRLPNHHVEYLWKRRQRPDARVPVHCIHGGIEPGLRKFPVPVQPSVRFRELIREARGLQDLIEQRVRV